MTRANSKAVAACGARASVPARACVVAWSVLLVCAVPGHAAEGGLQDEVLYAERALPAMPAARPAPAVIPAPLVSGLDLRIPMGDAAPQAAAIAPATTPGTGSTPPLNARTELDRLLGGSDSSGGTFDYTALPKDLDDSARYDAREGADEHRRDRDFDATVSVMAGTGGVMQTRASVTVPLLDDQLTVRVSGATGSGYYRDFSGDRFGRGVSDGGLWNGDRRYFDGGRTQSGQSFGLDMRWTPSDSSSFDAHVSEENLRTRHHRR